MVPACSVLYCACSVLYCAQKRITRQPKGRVAYKSTRKVFRCSEIFPKIKVMSPGHCPRPLSCIVLRHPTRLPPASPPTALPWLRHNPTQSHSCSANSPPKWSHIPTERPTSSLEGTGEGEKKEDKRQLAPVDHPKMPLLLSEGNHQRVLVPIVQGKMRQKRDQDHLQIFQV